MESGRLRAADAAAATTAVSLVLADHDALVRAEIESMLGQMGVMVVAQSGDGQTAINGIMLHQPELALLDARLPRRSGIEAAEWVRCHGIRTRVLLLADSPERCMVAAAWRAGAWGMVLKADVPKMLERAIAAVISGEVYLSSRIVGTGAGAPAGPDASDALTPRELQVLKLLARGLPSKEIAHELHMSVRTVDTHRSSISTKTRIRSIAQLTKYAVRAGLSDLDD